MGSMTVPTQHQALFAQSAGGGEFKLSTVEVPQPGSGQVLVCIEAAGLNPVDWKIHDYGFGIEFPAVLGTDSAGVVVRVGDGVKRFKVGDRILHQGNYENRNGSFQEYTLIHEDLAAKIPPLLSFDQAASIPVALAAAVVGLYGDKVQQGGAALTPPWKADGRGKYANQPILILGGASSVGQYVIQLAKLSGFSPIITTVSSHNDPLVLSLGATHPVSRSLPVSQLLPTIQSIITSSPITAVFDTVSSEETQQAGYDALADDSGCLVVVLPDAVKNKKEGSGKEVISIIGSGHIPGNRKVMVGMYEALEGLLEAGDIKPNQVEVIPGGLAGVAVGLEKLKQNKVSGRKLVVRPSETTTA